MEVNLTLFVQMGNFAMAYCLLRYLFFKPALALLDKKEQQALLAKNKLQEHELSLVKQREQVENAWRQSAEQFKKDMPEAMVNSSSFFRDITPTFNPAQIHEAQWGKKQQELERVIAKEVSHVRS